MPYPNEHACRIREPGEFQKGSFRRMKKGKLSIIIGRLKGKTTTTTQAYRYPKKSWSASAASAHCKRHEGRFEAAAKEIDVIEDGPIETEESKARIISIVPAEATSFNQVDEYERSQEINDRVGEITRQFETLSTNILNNSDVVDKEATIKSLIGELDDRLIKAIKSEKGLVETVMKKVSKIIKIKPRKTDDVKRSSLIFWKEGDRYRFMAIYSNKYRDNDLPPEILAEAAHERFVKEVEENIFPYPELWHWHIPGTRWGQSDWLHYDKDTGFIMASGFVDKGHEKEAEAIAIMEEPAKVSHGMPGEFLERDEEDKSIITRYVSLEISDLPAYAAANQLTGFDILKEVDNMSIPDDKKEYLRKAGVSDEKIEEIEKDLESKATTAKEEGLEFKEAEVVTAEDIAEAEVVDLTEEEPEGETEEPAEQQFATREEVAEAITEVVAPIAEAVAGVTESVATIAASVKDMAKSEDEKLAEIAKDTPAASIAALVARNFRAVGSEKAKVDGDEDIKGPKEEEVKEAPTGIPWIDKMITEE